MPMTSSGGLSAITAYPAEPDDYWVTIADANAVAAAVLGRDLLYMSVLLRHSATSKVA